MNVDLAPPALQAPSEILVTNWSFLGRPGDLLMSDLQFSVDETRIW
jgi:hypothetical protein